MTLEASGILNLKGSSAAPTRSIEFECEGDYTGDFALTTASSLASFTLPTGMTDFYGYSACSETIPAVPTGISASWAGTPSGLIRVYFTRPGNADGIDCQDSPNNSTWADFYMNYTGTSPLSATNSCTQIYYRVRSYNCAGAGSWSSGVLATGTC